MTDNNRYGVWLGWIVIIGQLIINRWTVRALAGDLLLEWLSPFMSISLTYLNLIAICLGAAIINGRNVKLKGFGIYGLLLVIMSLPLALFYRQMGYPIGYLECYFYGQTYTLLIFLPLILLLPQTGTLIAYFLALTGCFIQIIYMHYYKSDFGMSAFFAIFETNSLELKSFVSKYIFDLPAVFSIIAGIVLFCALAKKLKGCDKNALRFSYIAFAIPVMLFLLVPSGRTKLPRYNFSIKLCRSLYAYNQARRQASEIANVSLENIGHIKTR